MIRAIVVMVVAGVSVGVGVGVGVADELAPRPNVQRIEHRAAGTAPALGPSTALVTIELYFIPGAPKTVKPYVLLGQLQSAHPSRCRVVFRILRRGRDLLVPIAAAEAHAQGRFFEFMALARQNMRRQEVLEVARNAGMDTTRLEDAWEDGRHETALDANEARRQRMHARNLPDITVNGVGPTNRQIDTSSFELATLEAMYDDAYDRAIELLDRGVPQAHLVEAFDRVAQLRHPDQVFAPGPIDDPDPSEPLDAPPILLDSPLDTRGWPSIGKADAAVPIVILCNLRTVACRNQIVNQALKMYEVFGDQVRVVWAPMFDPGADDAAATTMINDAALCAEELGLGWTWIEQAVNVAYRRHGRPGDPDKEIDAVIAATELDRGAVARCLASSAGASARVVARVRKSGVRSAPSLVVGGRIYPGGTGDWRMLLALVEDELAPGVLEALVPSWSRAPR